MSDAPHVIPGERAANHYGAEALEEFADQEFDVIVVGAGGAGAFAAIEIHDRGGSVLILEKSRAAGGNTDQSGGSLRQVSDPEAMTEHFWQLAQGATPQQVVRSFINVLAEAPEWIARHGGAFGETDGGSPTFRMIFPATHSGPTYPEFAGAHTLAGRIYVKGRHPGREGGAALWDFLSDQLCAARIPIVLGARVDRLVVDPSSRAVRGVVVSHRSKTTEISPRRAVVLACGGFAYDDERMIQSVGVSLPTVSRPERATGDGIRLALDVGADLWHMSALSTSVGYQFLGCEAAFYCEIREYGFLVVDQRAQRYVNETTLENHSAVHAMLPQDAHTGRFLRTPSFVIFDERTRRAGPVVRQPNGDNRNYPWSPDNSAEVAKGWITSGETIAELASSLKIPVEALEESVLNFNRHANDEAIDTLGRPRVEMRPIVEAPYYGIPIYPVVLNTQGGPRRDERGRILRPDGRAIEGLYGAGELGSIWGRLYPGTGNISECFTSGLIAARDIVASSSIAEGSAYPSESP